MCWGRTEAPAILLQADLPVHCHYYVYADSYTIRKNWVPYTARVPGFVCEIALLTGRSSSATVELPAGVRYVQIPIEGIRELMERSQGFKNGMVALFVRDLAMKVSFSTPIDRGAPVTASGSPPPETLVRTDAR